MTNTEMIQAVAAVRQELKTKWFETSGIELQELSKTLNNLLETELYLYDRLTEEEKNG